LKISKIPKESWAKGAGKALLVAAGFMAIIGAPSATAAPCPIVPTASGNVEGFINSNVAEFLGIPHAAPPVGDLR
jgi:para-nitrobenzyl esterase